MIDANSEMDSQPGIKEDPSLHYDAESFAEAHVELSQRWSQMVLAITGDRDYDTGRKLLGRSLHAIQVGSIKYHNKKSCIILFAF